MECSEDFVGSSPFKLAGDAPSSAQETSPEDGADVGGSQQDAKDAEVAEAEVPEEEQEFAELDDDDDIAEDDADRGRGKRVRKEATRLDPGQKSKISKKPKAAKGTCKRGQQPGPRGRINPHTGEREKMTYNKGGRPPKNTGDKPKAGVHTHTLPK